jgi:hypothetical protein
MAEKVHVCNIKREAGYLYYIDSRGNVGRFRQGSSHKEIVCPNGGEFTKESGWLYYLDKKGDVSRSKMKGFREYAEVREELTQEEWILLTEKNWIQGAINPAHKGYCTPETKATCTPRRKALAHTLKGMHHKKK